MTYYRIIANNLNIVCIRSNFNLQLIKFSETDSLSLL